MYVRAVCVRADVVCPGVRGTPALHGAIRVLYLYLDGSPPAPAPGRHPLSCSLVCVHRQDASARRERDRRCTNSFIARATSSFHAGAARLLVERYAVSKDRGANPCPFQKQLRQWLTTVSSWAPSWLPSLRISPRWCRPYGKKSGVAHPSRQIVGGASSHCSNRGLDRWRVDRCRDRGAAGSLGSRGHRDGC